MGCCELCPGPGSHSELVSQGQGGPQVAPQCPWNRSRASLGETREDVFKLVYHPTPTPVSQRTLTPDTAVAVKGTAPQRGGQPQGASAEREPHVLGGSPTPHWASGSLLQDADLTVHSQNDGQGRLWTRADVGHTIAGSP